MSRPIVEDLKAAINDYCNVKGIAGAESEALRKIIELRRQKTTWSGKDELAFRFHIDAQLDEIYPDWRRDM